MSSEVETRIKESRRNKKTRTKERKHDVEAIKSISEGGQKEKRVKEENRSREMSTEKEKQRRGTEQTKGWEELRGDKDVKR